MTGSTGTPPTTPTQDPSVRTAGTGQSTVEKTLDSRQPAPEKIIETNPPAGQTTTTNTITVDSDIGRDQQDRGGQSGNLAENLTETASQYGRDMGHRASEAYEQGRQVAGQAWDTARRTADQVRRRGSRGLSSAQSALGDNPMAGILAGVAVGAMVGYLIGRMTAPARTTGPYWYEGRDEYGDAGQYPGGSPGGSYSSSSQYPDGDRRTDINRYADRVRYSDGI
jgi:ElaB/YqjD/DUF883 family membrane-anchored ribosome-binding protein